MLRAAVKAGTPLGLAAKKVMDSGGLVERRHHHRPGQGAHRPARLRRRLPVRRLSRAPSPQAEAMQARRREARRVLEIDVPDSAIIERMSGRRVHAASGRTYHLKFNPPKVAGQRRRHRRGADPARRRPRRDREQAARGLPERRPGRWSSTTRAGRPAGDAPAPRLSHDQRHRQRRGDHARGRSPRSPELEQGRRDAMDIAGKVFIVTGGASGLGEGTARMLAEHGAKVVVADLQADRGQAVAGRDRRPLRAVRRQRRKPTARRWSPPRSALGKLVGLVNCAGIAPAASRPSARKARIRSPRSPRRSPST